MISLSINWNANFALTDDTVHKDSILFQYGQFRFLAVIKNCWSKVTTFIKVGLGELP